MLPLPLLFNFLLDIKIFNSFTRFCFKKLFVNVIPVSKKILEKPNFLALISTSLKSKFPTSLTGIL